MKVSYFKMELLILIACLPLFLTAPIQSSKNSPAPIQSSKNSPGCNQAKGAIRSSVETDNTDKQVHLLADLDALANGVKRSDIERGCNDTPDKKSETNQVKELSVGSIPKDKIQTVRIIKETTIVNEDDIGKMPIIETGKAAIRSEIVMNASGNATQTGNLTAPQTNSTEGNSSINIEKNNSDLKPEEQKQGNTTASVAATVQEPVQEPVQGTAAKTFISKGIVDVNANKRSGALQHKNKMAAKVAKNKNAAKKSHATVTATHRSLHASSVPDDAPSMQKGSLSKESEKQEKATTKSTSNILSPLNSAIKSLDSATKLLGMAATSKNGASATSVKTGDKSAAITAPIPSNMTSPDVTSTARSASSSASPAKGSSAAPAKGSATGSKQAAAAPAPVHAAPRPADPYAEIASGPDSPKVPDLKTGSDKAGLPVMKVGGENATPEPVSFDKGEPQEVREPAAAPVSSSGGRPGPQDVGGILDQITDKLNKGGVAPENPLPPTEAKSITDQLSQYDHDALETAKGWESTGLKAIEKLKSAEYTHGSMKTELSKELSDRLSGGGGYGAALGASIEGEEPPALADSGYESQPQVSQGPQEAPQVQETEVPQQASYSRQQQSSQWPEFNSIQNLDSEAQREEQNYVQNNQFSDERGGGQSYNEGSEAMMSQDRNGYDRQDIPSFLNQGMMRENMDTGSEQGQYYKRSLILKPYYYYYHHLPYAFKHPYDD